MIRINLLTVDRERAKRKAKFQIGQKVTVFCSLILVAAALVVGWWFWSLQRTSADLDQQIADAERETQRLQSVIQQVAQFEARRAQLQQRVTLIEELRKGQTGPVHLLDQISKALPEGDVAGRSAAGGQRHHARRAVHVAEFVVGFRERAGSVEPVRAAGRDYRQPRRGGDNGDAGIDSVFGAGAAACEGGRLMAVSPRPDTY